MIENGEIGSDMIFGVTIGQIVQCLQINPAHITIGHGYLLRPKKVLIRVHLSKDPGMFQAVLDCLNRSASMFGMCWTASKIGNKINANV